MGTPLRSYLYVPAHQERYVAKAFASTADAVVLDLEDSVPPQAKDAAREAAAALLADGADGLPKPTFVRVNPMASGRTAEDIAAVAGPRLAGIRLPKAENADSIREVGRWLARPDRTASLHLLVESALGLEQAFELAGASPALGGLSLGETDLAADLRATDPQMLDFARIRCVMAARAAGLPSPVQSVYPRIHDEAGLRASCRRGKALGFFGRSAVHPVQLPVINAEFTPTDAEVADAAALVEALDEASAEGRGATVTRDGRLVDAAVIRSARRTLALAGHYSRGDQ